MRFATLGDIMNRDGQVRVWCFRCSHGREMTLEQIGRHNGMCEDMPLADLGRRFRCGVCRRNDQVLVLPATLKGRRGFNKAVGAEQANTDLVAHFFHAMRGASRRRGR